MRDADEEIREIKKEVVESRGLVIKTNNLVNALAADIKSIAKRQAGYERRMNWNGAVAYVLFAVLSFVSLKLLSDARFREIESEQEGLARQATQLRAELAEQTRRSDRRRRAETDAAQLYRLVQEGKRREMLEGYAALKDGELSPAEAAFFADTARRFTGDLAIEAYHAGLDRLRTGRYAEAAESFGRALSLDEAGAHVPGVRFGLADALRRLGRYDQAALVARAVVEQRVDPELQDDAAWLLSEIHEGQGKLEEAREDLRALLRRWPRSALAQSARQRIAHLSLRILQGRRPDAPARG